MCQSKLRAERYDRVRNTINAKANLAVLMTASVFPQQFHEADSQQRRTSKAAGDPGNWARGMGLSSSRHFTLITKLEHDSALKQITKLKVYTWGRSYSLSMPYETLYANLYEIVVARLKIAKAADNTPN